MVTTSDIEISSLLNRNLLNYYFCNWFELVNLLWSLIFIKFLKFNKTDTVINGVPSENTKVVHGIPHGSVLGPILFALYTSDLPKAVNSVTMFLYADDTTMYCVGKSVDQVTATLSKALEELVQTQLFGTAPQKVRGNDPQTKPFYWSLRQFKN